MSNNVLIQPLVTEKLTRLMEEGHYTFEVRMDANKVEIKKAVKDRYPTARIKSVRTLIVRGKRRSQQTRRGTVSGRTAYHKRAIVTLTEDSEPIDFFEQV
ncbi:MAG: 50S ribosomal protein L23 [Rhodothermales bacterium]